VLAFIFASKCLHFKKLRVCFQLIIGSVFVLDEFMQNPVRANKMESGQKANLPRMDIA
jgi:hypothetical protein